MQQLDLKTWSAMPSLGGAQSHANTVYRPSSVVTDEQHRLDAALSLLFPSTVHVHSSLSLSGHIHSLRMIVLSNGARLLLKGSPSSSTALLRRERSFLENEAQFLALLGQSGNPCIPQLYNYDPYGRSWGSPYLIRQYMNGKKLSEMENELSHQQRDGIDRHLGFLLSTIGQNAAPGFGTLQQVARGAGTPSWRDAFCALFEGILRDAEDTFVHLPYSEIRDELSRLAPALEGVTLPRLVVVDFGRPSHILLDEESKQLSGIVDFSSALWGDVLMAEIFENPSQAILQGAGISLFRTREEQIRLSLYACYRLISQITVQYYRARDEASEFDSRRRLTTTIAEMTRFEI